MRINLLLALMMFFSEGISLAADACDPKGKVYPSCSDQNVILKDAMAQAKAEKKPLLLVFGADWCPWCQSMHKILRDAELPEAKDYYIAEIALYEGQEKLESGVEALGKVLGYAGKDKAGTGIPIVALVNPVNEKASIVEVKSLEKNSKVSKGHDPKKLFAALKKARKSIE